MQPEEGKKRAAGGSKSGSGEGGPAPKILIADDDLQSVELLEAYLADTGYEVRTSTDGEATLRETQQWQPDVILLDIMMPKISGFEVCKRLRANSSSRSIGVLMITALDQSSDVERAVEAGTDDFLTKPINKTDLLLRIRSLLKSRQNRSNLDRALAYIEAVERGEK
jgi:two-component system, OmpR family, alkaline phosphatase synthesis response regulator PhoP